MHAGIRSAVVASVLSVAFVGASGRAAFAQHGGMHGSMPMQHDASMDADQMMKKVDAKLNAAAASMSDLAGHHASMEPNATGDRLVSSLQGMLAQMQQFRGDLAEMMRDPAHMQQPDAMKGIEQACRDFEQMASAFQSIAKNMGRVMTEHKTSR